jgi:hypothetical protein
MGDIGKKVRTGHWPEPVPMPQFLPTKREVEVPERELVPVKREEVRQI